jgi:hypothetical protein
LPFSTWFSRFRPVSVVLASLILMLPFFFIQGAAMNFYVLILAPEFPKAAVENSLLGRAVGKDDIARQIVLFCASDSFTGQTLAIDSGRVFH